MIADKYYLGAQELMALDSTLIKSFEEADKRVFGKLIGNIAVADQSESIQELDYFFLKHLNKKYPGNGAVEKVFKRIESTMPKKYEQGFDAILGESETMATGGTMASGGLTWSELKEQNPELWETGILRRSLDPYGATVKIPKDIHTKQGLWQNYGQYDEIEAESIYGPPDRNDYGYYKDKDGNIIDDIRTGLALSDEWNNERMPATICNEQLKRNLIESFSTKEGKEYLRKVIEALPKNADGTIPAYRIGEIGQGAKIYGEDEIDGKVVKSYTVSEGMAKTFSNQGTDIMPSGLPGLPSKGYEDFGDLKVNKVNIDPRGIVAWSPYDSEILVENSSVSVETIEDAKKGLKKFAKGGIVDVFREQSKNLEDYVHGDAKWKGNFEYVHKFEKAGDIFRELAKNKNGFVDGNYLAKNIRLLFDYINDKEFGEDVTGRFNAYSIFKEQNKSLLSEFRKGWANQRTNTKAQEHAKSLVLSVIDADKEKIKIELDYFTELRKNKELLAKQNSFEKGGEMKGDGGILNNSTFKKFRNSFQKIPMLHGARYVSDYFDKPIHYSNFSKLYTIEFETEVNGQIKHKAYDFKKLEDAIHKAYFQSQINPDFPQKIENPDMLPTSIIAKSYDLKPEIVSIIDKLRKEKFAQISEHEIAVLDDAISFSIAFGDHAMYKDAYATRGGLTRVGITNWLESMKEDLLLRTFEIAPEYLTENEKRYYANLGKVRSEKDENEITIEHEFLREYGAKFGEMPTRYIKYNEAMDELEIYPSGETKNDGEELFRGEYTNEALLDYVNRIAIADKKKLNPRSVEILQNDNAKIIGFVPGMHKKKFPYGKELLDLTVKEIVWAGGEIREQADEEIEPLMKELKLLRTSMAAIKNKKSEERTSLKEKIDELQLKIRSIESDQESVQWESWDALVEYLKEFSVKTGLLGEDEVTDYRSEESYSENFVELTGELSSCIWEEAYREKTWDDKLLDVWLGLVINYKAGEDIQLYRDYTVPQEHSQQSGLDLPMPVVSFVDFILRGNSTAKLIYAGYNTALPVTINDMLPAWTAEFISEDILLRQEDILTAFNCRVKVIVKESESTSKKKFFKTYFILPYKVGPGDPQIARKYFLDLERQLVKNQFHRKEEFEKVGYADKLNALNRIFVAEADFTDWTGSAKNSMLYIDAHTSYTKEQLIVFFNSQPKGTEFSVLLFGAEHGFTRNGKQGKLIKGDVLYTISYDNVLKEYRAKNQTPEDIANMILGWEMIVLTEKSPYKKIIGDKENTVDKNNLSQDKTKLSDKSWVDEQFSLSLINKSQPPTPKISLEFDMPSEYGETTCVIDDVAAVAERGWCPCGDGSDYRFNAFEIQQLREIAESGETQSFVPISKLKYPLNWVAKMKVDGHALVLPTERMNAKEYADVKNIMQKAGGTYKKNSFIFEEPAADIYLRILSGEDYNLKKKFQYFPTPAATADYMVKLADIKCGMSFLEPSAGRGSIINAIHRVCPDAVIDYWEIMETNRKYLSEIPNTNFMGVMFENAMETSEKRYDRIIANPPFSNNQDENHIYIMYELLKPSGKLVTVSSNHWQFAKEKSSVNFRLWIEKVGAQVIEVPSGTFKESGTMIPTLIIVIDKK